MIPEQYTVLLDMFTCYLILLYSLEQILRESKIFYLIKNSKTYWQFIEMSVKVKFVFLKTTTKCDQ